MLQIKRKQLKKHLDRLLNSQGQFSQSRHFLLLTLDLLAPDPLKEQLGRLRLVTLFNPNHRSLLCLLPPPPPLLLASL